MRVIYFGRSARTLEIFSDEGTSDSRRAAPLQGLKERGYLREADVPRAMVKREEGGEERRKYPDLFLQLDFLQLL